MKKKVIIIGGGFAGLTAAAELCSSGYQVTLIEQRGFLGGRAYSFIDKHGNIELDNGQHILMGCYENTFRFLKTIGALDNLYIQESLSVDFLDKNGDVYSLDCPDIPAPLHIASGILGFSALSLPDRFRMLKVSKDLLLNKTDRTLEDSSITEWLNRLGQGKESRDNFWGILSYAVMNEGPDSASAYLFKNVLRKAFFSSRKGSRIVLPALPLSRMYVDSAEDYINKHGGIIKKTALVSGLIIKNDNVSGIRLRDGEIIKGDFYISAVPYFALKRIIPEDIMISHYEYFGVTEKLKPSPIISIHMLFDRTITDCIFFALINSPVQWVFNKGLIYRDKAPAGLLSLVISGAHNYISWSSKDILDMSMKEIEGIFPGADSARLLYSKVIKERAATFSPQPGVERFRPSRETPIRNLFLAGDWTDTGIPATIEGAVISGYKTAELIKKEPF